MDRADVAVQLEWSDWIDAAERWEDDAVPSSGDVRSTRVGSFDVELCQSTCVPSPFSPWLLADLPLISAHATTVAAHVALVKSAFSAFADLADLYPLSMREELYAIAFHFYSRASSSSLVRCQR